MELLLNRYRNLTVLLLTILAQLVLLAYQVKSNQEVRLIRVWSVTAVTPLARAIESGRASLSRFFKDYFVLLDVREENKRMKAELDRVQMENQYLRTELSTADRARSLAIFQEHSPSKTIAAHIIGNTTGTGARVVIVDRGSVSGIQKGMAVITPDGIVGKVSGVYPTASFVKLVTDPTFAAGVMSQKNRVHGTLKGQGRSDVMVDDVQNEQNVEQGEWFYTSGEDLIFPKGLPVGAATVVRQGKNRKEIFLSPSGFQNGLEEVLIVVEGVHAPIPEAPTGNQPVHLLAPPPPESVEGAAAGAPTPAPATIPAPTQPSIPPGAALSEADRIVERYRKIGEAQKHTYGVRGAGAPNFNANPDDAAARKAPEVKLPEAKLPEAKAPGVNAPAPKPPEPVKQQPVKPAQQNQ